jgi:hypothetical protein
MFKEERKQIFGTKRLVVIVGYNVITRVKFRCRGGIFYSYSEIARIYRKHSDERQGLRLIEALFKCY